MVRQGFQPLPGEVGKARGQQHHEQKNPSPQLGFFALQIFRWTVLGSAGISCIGSALGHEGAIRLRVQGTAKPSIIQTIRNYTGGGGTFLVAVGEFDYFGLTAGSWVVDALTC